MLDALSTIRLDDQKIKPVHSRRLTGFASDVSAVLLVKPNHNRPAEVELSEV